MAVLAKMLDTAGQIAKVTAVAVYFTLFIEGF